MDFVLRTTQLRTLLPSSSSSFDYLSNGAVHQLVSGMKLLRVLSLSWCENFKELPETIGDLKYLLYLDLSNTLVETLPKSVGRLYNLQILKLSRCRKLTQLPNNIHRLLNLRHLDIGGCHTIKEIPRQIGRLKSVQTLTSFVVGKYGAKIGELGELLELRGNVCLENLENVANGEDASKVRLANKKKLEELTFSWSRDTEDPEDDKGVLEELLSGTELKRLNIIRYRDMEFPNCFQNPNTISSIVSIKLERCRHCRSLPALGKLPSLKTLYIKQLDGVVIVSKEFYGTNGKSASLESLSFSSMSAWKEWNSTWVGVKDGEVFPKLRELCISDCDRLITVHLPQNLPSLTKLIIPSPLLTSTALHPCGNLKDIKDAGKSLSLSSLFIKGCPKFISFNEGRLRAPNLNSLTVEGCEKLTKLPGQMPYLLPSLKKLLIINCPQVESFPAGGLPSNLNGLLVDKCSKLTANRMEWNLQTLSALEYFDIRDESDANMESFPEMGLLPSCLTSLRIGPLASLKELDMKQLQQLTSLKSLDIQSCPELTTLKFGRASEAPTLPKLRSFCIKDCQNFTYFPKAELNAPDLNSLTVEYCKNLKKLQGRMHDLLPSLERLWILDCPNMELFPEGGLPSKLNGLLVSNCTSLIKNRNDWNL
ncbi:putative disease resistance protein At3g14460 [Ziziphus jujuba]|uniref:Disease resistance protein At3g14460 n=1 Tax=Ziziphus jujuba TaxID=326968 RepID=A0A6P4AFD9_ZIZJJ|nr:putative disease resistance protein At3g14460 [Ziziphus jujuba]